MQRNWNRHRILCKAAITRIWKLDLIHFRQWDRENQGCISNFAQNMTIWCLPDSFDFHSGCISLWLPPVMWFPHLNFSERKSQPSSIFPQESIIFSPLSRQLRPPGLCGIVVRELLQSKKQNDFWQIFRNISFMWIFVSPSTQHSASAILLRWYLSKLSVDK